MWPPGRAHFWPRGIIWTNLVEVHLMMIHTKYQDSRPCDFRQEDFLKILFWKSFFSLCDLDMEQNGTILKIIKEDYIRIISAKFGQNPGSGFRHEDFLHVFTK